jgi:serine/threonine-protein kinase
MVPAALYLVLVAVIAAVLSGKRTYTMRQLRWFEGVLFGLTVMQFLNETYVGLFTEPFWLSMYAQRHPSEMSILGRQPSIFWMTLIIAYGTFVPNTGRRCAAVTTLMALAPLTLIGSVGMLQGQVPTRSLLLLLVEMVIWLGIGVAIAIYGSHKITVLREEAMAARKLGQYQLQRQLGAGGMGEVYLAEHVLLKRPCAVKVIRPEQAGDATTLQRFLREVQVTSTLTHPNTVQVFDYGQAEDGTVYYAMEYLTGLSLEDLVRVHGPLPPGRTIGVLRQLCGALAEAHGIGLIHRDIKPSNVILCSRGGVHDVAKLLDFGLVRTQAMAAHQVGLTQAGMVFGTPTYMSPEQAVGNDLDARSDIYSLGALAYFLLTGQPPFVRDSIVQVLAAHINEAITPPRTHRPTIPPDLEAVVLRCLAKNPDDRFADVASLEQALGACGAASDWMQSDAAVWWSVVPAQAADTRDGSRGTLRHNAMSS